MANIQGDDQIIGKQIVNFIIFKAAIGKITTNSDG
jgi:hypothetical protein